MPQQKLACNACNTLIARQPIGRRGHWCPKCKAMRSTNGVHIVRDEPAPKAAPAQPPAPPPEPPEGPSVQAKDEPDDEVLEDDVTAIHGVGKATADRLAKQGISTVGELAEALKTGAIEDDGLAGLLAAHLASEG